MKILLLTVLLLGLQPETIWKKNFEEAKKEAQQTNRLLLLNFSGSDWCAPCIRLRREILDSDAFLKFADTSLVMVNADFPRLKKNALSKEQVKQNEALAEQYNPKGKFPFTVILNADGTVLKSFDGYPNITINEFIAQIKSVKNVAN